MDAEDPAVELERGEEGEGFAEAGFGADGGWGCEEAEGWVHGGRLSGIGGRDGG